MFLRYLSISPIRSAQTCSRGAGTFGLLLSFLVWSLAGQGFAQDAWVRNPANGHLYRLTEAMNWQQAEAQAVAWGGHLVTINDKAEEDWIRSKAGKDDFFWIGFNDLRQEGIWEWASSEAVTYTNWASGEPNNRSGDDGGAENAAVMNWGGCAGTQCYTGDYWNDVKTIYGYRGIVEKADSACSYSMTPSSQAFPSSGGDGSIAITTASGCPWTAASPDSWIAITSGLSGNGSGTVRYTVAANTGADFRTGTITVASLTFLVSQPGSSPACSYAIAPTEQSFTALGGTGNIAVTTQPGCRWTTTTDASWVTIVTGSSGVGSGTVIYSVAASSEASMRSAAVIIGGKAHTIVQAHNEPLTDGAKVQISLELDQTVQLEISVSAGMPNLFVLLKKYDSWFGAIELWKDGQLQNRDSGWSDHALHLQNPVAETYQLKITGAGSGMLSILSGLPELKLGEWTVGTIVRSNGSAWYQVTLPPGQTTLSVTVETLGLFSQLDISLGQLSMWAQWYDFGDKAAVLIPSPAPGAYYICLTDSAWYSDGQERSRDHLIKADVNPIDAPPSNPSITEIFPSHGGNSGLVTVSVKGRGLMADATVTLSRPGGGEITSMLVRGSDDGRCLWATFDLMGALEGSWDLIVENSGSMRLTSPTPFVVEGLVQPLLQVQITGRDQIRAGRPASYFVSIHNPGNVDSELAFLFITLPKGLDCHLVRSEEDAIWDRRVNGEDPLTFVLPPIPPGRSISLELSLSAPSIATEARSGEDRRIVWYLKLAVDLFVVPELHKFGQIFLKRKWDEYVRDPQTGLPLPDWGQAFKETYREWAGLSTQGPLTLRAWFSAHVKLMIAWLEKAGKAAAANLLKQLWAALWSAPRWAEAIRENIKENPYVNLAAASIKPIEPVTSISPEDKFGPTGFDPPDTSVSQRKGFISAREALDYRIDFWNREDAPAPTQDVIITDQLDADLDWKTLSFTELGFLKWRVPLEGGPYFRVNVDLRPDKNLIVEVEGTFDRATGAVRWEFHALDPATRKPPEDPMAGFLPPITDSGYEIGWVSFIVKPKSGLSTGTRIENQAQVKFDVDVFKPAPAAGPFVNTIDSGTPSSAVTALPAHQNCPSFAVSWSGSDDSGGSGLRSYTVHVSDNAGPFSVWVADTTKVSALFTGQPGHTYQFYSAATDNVGNAEPTPAQPDATVTITGALSVSPTSQSFTSAGGTGSITVTGSSGCAWSSSTNAAWLSVASGGSGSGSGAVAFTVAPNVTSASRSGSLMVAGQTVTITQAGNSPDCSFSLSQGAQAFGSGGGNASVEVTAPAGCAWAVTSEAPWIAILLGKGGVGSGTVTFAVTANPNPGTRTAAINIAGKAFAVTQSGTAGSTAASLYFPRLASSQANPAQEEEGEYTGAAVANLGATSAHLTFTAYNGDGGTLQGPAITNPRSMTLKPGEQTAMVDFEIFGAGLPLLDPRGWFKVESTSANIAGFFLTFDEGLHVLDGADSVSGTLDAFVLPEVEKGGFTQICIANPGSTAANLSLRLVGADGIPRGPAATRSINPTGALAEAVSEIFPGLMPSDSDYVLITSDKGVVAFELFGRGGRHVAGLNGQDPRAAATMLYSPQYAIGGQAWTTALSIINLDSVAGTVAFKLLGDDGTQLGATRVLPIAPSGKITITDRKFFLDPGDNLVQGYVEITGSGIRLAGSVAFGDAAQERYRSALPLISATAKDLVFGQVASDGAYFTGLALLNTNDTDATATIEVLDKAGVPLSATRERIGAKRRRSRLLTELFPALVGQPIRSGYVRVQSDHGLVGFALFGTGDVLSAVPPQTVP